VKNLIAYFIKHPIWANVLMVAILGFGWFSMKNMRTSFFPESDPSRITVSLVYPGTSPEEIEQSLITKIERSLRGVSGIDYTSSQSRENFGTITVRTTDRADVDEVLEDVKSAVDGVMPWPDGAEEATIRKIKFVMPAMIMALTADLDPWTLKLRADELEDELLNTEGISKVDIQGLPGREIAIEMSEENLRRYNLTFDDVVAAVRTSNIDISGGKVETNAEELLVRAYDKEADVNHIRTIVVNADPSGTMVRLGDVASVIEKWESTPSLGH
jgi:multidrug efflux pump subunit AcrB